MDKTTVWKALEAESGRQSRLHMRTTLRDSGVRLQMRTTACGLLLDYSRQKADEETLKLLFDLAEEMNIKTKISQLFAGISINTTEHRAALHVALRADEASDYSIDGVPVGPQVVDVQRRVANFAHAIRTHAFVGATGLPLMDILCVGIGGSHLGVECVYEALKLHPQVALKSTGRRLVFIANVDPLAFSRATHNLMQEKTLVVVVSKTFTTVETMLSAQTVKAWLLERLPPDLLHLHFAAVSTNATLTANFGIPPDRVFPFWDWVGGRYSVTSAVGLLPLSLVFGSQVVDSWLQGCRDMDNHFRSAPLRDNLPVLMALLSVWNTTFCKTKAVAVIPYSEALHKFPAHIQQVTMESNGKGVTVNGDVVHPNCTGEVFFGEPGTNAQHSFFQLCHQGQVIPVEFIGVKKAQKPAPVIDHPIDAHDELMINMMAQADALALGATGDEVASMGVDIRLIPHKTFPGNRPSLLIWTPVVDAYYMGTLLALYEHRVAVQGFLWNINSFDQMGVELGKSLASEMREIMARKRRGQKSDTTHTLLPSTAANLAVYLSD